MAQRNFSRHFRGGGPGGGESATPKKSVDKDPPQSTSVFDKTRDRSPADDTTRTIDLRQSVDRERHSASPVTTGPGGDEDHEGTTVPSRSVSCSTNDDRDVVRDDSGHRSRSRSSRDDRSSASSRDSTRHEGVHRLRGRRMYDSDDNYDGDRSPRPHGDVRRSRREFRGVQRRSEDSYRTTTSSHFHIDPALIAQITAAVLASTASTKKDLTASGVHGPSTSPGGGESATPKKSVDKDPPQSTSVFDKTRDRSPADDTTRTIDLRQSVDRERHSASPDTTGPGGDEDHEGTTVPSRSVSCSTNDDRDVVRDDSGHRSRSRSSRDDRSSASSRDSTRHEGVHRLRGRRMYDSDDNYDGDRSPRPHGDVRRSRREFRGVQRRSEDSYRTTTSSHFHIDPALIAQITAAVLASTASTKKDLTASGVHGPSTSTPAPSSTPPQSTSTMDCDSPSPDMYRARLHVIACNLGVSR
ncbi:uncharacterized protein LOC125381940 [Haliotis rufescens]|uniref:uncharacterized protein LOC125381940 n=1 Tax=Haliotis rufescens TaxID=6454 RepID=UPI00201F512E|nr:uncharacterized protein LOC125381940 [Haliotis rufescens]